MSDLKALLASIMDIEEFLSKSKKDKGDVDRSPQEMLRDFLNSPSESPAKFDAQGNDNLTIN